MEACFLRHQKSLTSKIIQSMGRQTHNKSELHCNLKLCVLAKQEPNFKFAAAKSSKIVRNWHFKREKVNT